MDWRLIRDLLNSETEITAWEMTQEQGREHQLFVSMGQEEASRTIETEKLEINIYLERAENGRRVLGESRIVLDEGDDMASRVRSSLAMARLVSNEPFRLPVPGGVYPKVESYDASTASHPDQVLSQIRREIEGSVESEITLSCSEMTFKETDLFFLNSHGLELSDRRTRLFVDFVLLAGNDPHSEVESHGFKAVRFRNDLDIADKVHEYSRMACDSLSARLPPTGQLDVVLSHDALDTFFSYFIAQAGGPAKYQGWSRFHENEAVVAGCSGDRLTLLSDPTLPGGMNSAPFDKNGLPLKKVEVIKDGIFIKRLADCRYADYLDIEPTGNVSNVVVAPGLKSFDELLDPKPVIHVLKFSSFDPRPVTGSFSGEIRFGYLFEDGRKIPLKGGSVSGIMDQALQRMYFSRETMKRESYFGPMGVKICGLSVAGN